LEKVLAPNPTRASNPDKRERELSAAESCRKMLTALLGSVHRWKWLTWLSKMINRLSVGGLHSA
jgi:hypothetical protein